MRIAIVGAEGQLGADICREFRRLDHEVIALTHSRIQVESSDSVSSALDESRPQLLINTAAFHNVERCEQDPATAFAINALGARNLAKSSAEIGAVLIHISTDYVFDGAKRQPYLESDLPLPLNVYGNSKLAAENFVRSLAPKHYVLRTSGLYWTLPCRAKGGLNFVQLMLKLARERGMVKVVQDEWITPTFTEDLARQIVAVARSSEYGLYHASAEGSCSWYEFAAEIFRLTGTQVELQAASASDFPAKVPRPKYSVLENDALKSRGLNQMRHWSVGLSEYLATLALN